MALTCSEFFFLNEGPVQHVLAGSTLADRLIAVAAYLPWYVTAIACFAGLVSLVRPQTWHGLWLAGCIYGWTVEAALVPVSYEGPPFSYLWPAIAWHVPTGVILGLWLLPLAFAKGVRSAMLAGTAFALAWGTWATWAWIGPEPRLSPADFTRLVVTVTPIFCIGFWLYGRWGWRLWRLPSRVAWICLLPSALMFILTGTGFPIAAAGLALVILATAFALWRSADHGPSTHDHLPQPAPIAILGLVAFALLNILGAPAIYAIFWHLGHGIPTGFAILGFCSASGVATILSFRYAFTRR